MQQTIIQSAVAAAAWQASVGRLGRAFKKTLADFANSDVLEPGKSVDKPVNLMITEEY